MKKIILGIICISFLLVSFTVKSNKEITTPVKTTSIEKGKKLFNSKTCNACHQEKIKIVGPAIKTIAAKYTAKKGNIVAFLQGKNKAIVDTNPGQVAIMQASLSITKSMSKADLEAISKYMMSIQ
ncbi:MAG: c-type cytochrome [Polaribacter sp.]|nr:c-type cytochrome [Polaribacter sp.]